jgi:hypothetical protein
MFHFLKGIEKFKMQSHFLFNSNEDKAQLNDFDILSNFTKLQYS